MSKVYGYCNAGCKREVVSKEDVPYKQVELTQEEYNALSDEEKNKAGVMYLVDGQLSANNVSDTIYGMAIEDIFVFDDGDSITPVVYDALNAENATNAENALIAEKLKTSSITLEDNGTVKVTKAGLYACVCENKTYPNIDRVSLLISIEDLSVSVYSQSYYYDSKVVYLQSTGISTIATITAMPVSADYQIVSCKLIVEY